MRVYIKIMGVRMMDLGPGSIRGYVQLLGIKDNRRSLSTPTNF
jgi:hypothetical protein